MRLKLLTLALAMAVVSLPSHGEDLLDAYRQARANDPVLSQADATRRSTGEGVDQARAALLPQINANLTLSQTNGNGSNSSLTGSVKPRQRLSVQRSFRRYRNLCLYRPGHTVPAERPAIPAPVMRRRR
jgi:outer membrane protein